jgi:hypothetical protein
VASRWQGLTHRPSGRAGATACTLDGRDGTPHGWPEAICRVEQSGLVGSVARALSVWRVVRAGGAEVHVWLAGVRRSDRGDRGGLLLPVLREVPYCSTRSISAQLIDRCDGILGCS